MLKYFFMHGSTCWTGLWRFTVFRENMQGDVA
ncbi:hypothetical protein GGR08_000566 [Bartonella fuyuanensis]|uniref:Uncharacterized protein n=1 Tax=Bartonella fuyuanensis TaxID=1460968 RepID=A0A840DX77_9HYPH|nr:hypothetical protein [Bartonella fuyuanensis]